MTREAISWHVSHNRLVYLLLQPLKLPLALLLQPTAELDIVLDLLQLVSKVLTVYRVQPRALSAVLGPLLRLEVDLEAVAKLGSFLYLPATCL